MLNFIKVLFIIIDINQETVLNWFGIKDSFITDNSSFDTSNVESLSTLQLVLKGLWKQIQDGLTNSFTNI